MEAMWAKKRKTMWPEMKWGHEAASTETAGREDKDETIRFMEEESGERRRKP